MSLYSYSEISNSMFHEIHTLFCGIQECAPLYSFGPAVRDCHLMHYCLKGKGSFYVGDYRYDITAGEGFLIYPHELTFYQADEHDPWTYLWIAVGGDDLEKYLHLAGMSHSHPLFHCSKPDKLKEIVSSILERNTLSYSNELFIHARLMDYFSLLVEDAGQLYKENGKISNIYINKAISYIHNNYQNPITVQEIADFLSLNRSYLTELFLKTVHFSPQQFLMKFRMTKATELLTDTTLSIENIAYSCGYSNSFSFSKAFRKVTGISPSQYRKEYQLTGKRHSRTKDPHEKETLIRAK